MKNSALLLPLLICLIVSSCKNSSDSPPSGDLIPLKAGNTWIYETTMTDSMGKVISIQGDTSKVGLSVEINGDSWQLFNFPGSAIINSNFVANRFDGVWTFDDQTLHKAIQEFAFPIGTGSEYLILRDTFGIDASIEEKGKLISANEIVKTQAGDFSCYHYQILLNEVTIQGKTSQTAADIFIAPNIGIIKTVEPTNGTEIGTVVSNPPMTTNILKEYHLK